MNRVFALVDGAAKLAAVLSALLTVSIVVMILGEIVARSLFNYSLSFAWEYSAYAMGVAMFGGAAYALRTGGHIRVSLLASSVPPRTAYWIDILCTVLAIVISSYVALALIEFALRSYASGSTSPTVSATPLVIPQACIALGATLLAIQLLARLARLVLGHEPEDESVSFQVD